MKRWILLLVVSLLAAGAFVALSWQKKCVRVQAQQLNHATADTSGNYKKYLYHNLDTFFTNRSINNGFSGSVLISLKGEPIYEKCFGYCDFRSKNLMSDTTAFQLASVSKNFTATAVLWLVEHGKLSIDDTLQKFFPQLSYKNITVKMLLCHRSGLPNYLYFCSGNAVSQSQYLTNDKVVDVMIKQKPAMYARANKKFEYSNTNYILLASIVEKASGMKFKDFMQQTFFAPLGMTRSFIYDPTDSTDKKIAISYNTKWQIQHDDIFDGVVGDKGVYSTVKDMFKWDKAFYDGKLLSNEMMQEAYKPRSFEKPGVRNYGYGWRLTLKPDSNYLVYHNGWWHGNNTVFCRNIQDTATIIILSNKFNRAVYNVQPVWEILYGIKGAGGIEGEE